MKILEYEEFSDVITVSNYTSARYETDQTLLSSRALKGSAAPDYALAGSKI